MRARLMPGAALALLAVLALASQLAAAPIFEPFDSLPPGWETESTILSANGETSVDASSILDAKASDQGLVLAFDVPEQTGDFPSASHVLWAPFALPATFIVEFDTAVGPQAAAFAQAGYVLETSDGRTIRWSIDADGKWVREVLRSGIIDFSESLLGIESSNIAADPATNCLGLERTGRTLRFFLNGVAVDEVDATSTERLGLFFAVGAPQKRDIRVADFRLFDPTDLPHDLALPYSEGFDSVFSGWGDNRRIHDGKIVSYASHSDGAYVLFARGEWSTKEMAPLGPLPDAWTAQVDVVAHTVGGGTVYGMVWMTDSGREYKFYVDPQGYYSLDWTNSQSGESDVVVPWAPVGGLQNSTTAPRLRIDILPGLTLLSVNGAQLYTLTDEANVEGAGIFVRSFGEDNEFASVSFDNFAAYSLEEVGAQLDFRDAFDSPASGWMIESWSDGSAQYDAGRYVLKHKPAHGVRWVTAPIATLPSAFDIAVTGGIESGPLDAYYGLILQIDEDDIFFFEVSGDGWYIVEWMADGKWQTALVDWTESSFVRTGNAGNELKLTITESSIEFFVNSQSVAVLPSPGIGFAAVGLVITTYEHPDAEVWFDDFCLKEQ